ncbi:protein hinderin [Chanos chanos]|uniref:Protein hinderin n=1 Tax=Chanos chanos TaxID=29144 RepID=A0A6J2UTQ2_CHACN|nr:protein hinderin [Chanos chanos]
MATVARDRNNPGIFWINDTSDEDQSTVYVPGVSRKMGPKFRSCSSGDTKLKGRAVFNGEGKVRKKSLSLHSVESVRNAAQSQKTPTSVAKTRSPTLSSEPPLTSLTTLQQPLSYEVEAKSKASLKDLCPEDKRRIANLIQELARVSEEKEESVQRLRDEQETFERKIQQLEQQNQLIIQERESLQQQYRECQELLGLYQQYLSQQQEKLNKSIAQLNQDCSHRKVLSSEGTLARSWCEGGKGTALDGSYLDLPTFRGGDRKGGPVGCAHSFSEKRSSATPSSSSDRDCSHGGCSDSATGRRSKREHSAHGSKHLRRYPDLENGGVNPTGRAEATPGRVDWEEKKQRLLLQKKQLELERERLQARLAQQEERLIRQNQQLRQTRLDFSRCHDVGTAELKDSLNGVGHPNEVPQTSGIIEQSEETGQAVEILEGSFKQPGGDSQPNCKDVLLAQPVPPHDYVSTLLLCLCLSTELSAMAKKDMGTSPIVSSSFQKPGHSPVAPLHLPKTPQARLDSSLMELLDLFSPTSDPDRSKVSTQKRSATHHQPYRVLQPLQSNQLSPLQPHRPSQQDLEESQILEDIFFIC